MRVIAGLQRKICFSSRCRLRLNHLAVVVLSTHRTLELVLEENDFRRFDHSLHDVPLRRLYVFRALAGDHAFDEVVTDAHYYMRHAPTELDVFDGSL